jgi:hypothetical protein
MNEGDFYLTAESTSTDPASPDFRFEIIESEHELHDRQFSKKKAKRGDRHLPVLLARVSNDGINMIVWCPFCRCEHYHGTCGDPTGKAGEGHRVAHCHIKESPFNQTGYILKLDREWEKMKKATKGVRVKPNVACNHAHPLDVLNEALNRNAEVSSLLETVSRALFDSSGAR